MTRARWLWAVVAWTVVGVAALIALQQVDEAAAEYQDAQSRTVSIIRQVDDVTRLRNAHQHVSSQRHSDASVISRIRDGMRAAGVDDQTLTGVTPRDDLTQPGSAVRVQQVVVSLRGITLAQLGRWLNVVRGSDSPWRIRACDLIAERETDATPVSERFQVTVTMGSAYLGQ